MFGLKTKTRLFLTVIWGRNISKCKFRDAGVVSFDVFDTLIIREGVNTPADVFGMIGSKQEIESFKDNRIKAEKILRQKVKESYEDQREDVTLDEIYMVLSEMQGWDKEKCERIKNEELSTEYDVCRANPSALDFYNSIKASGKRIVIVSDMYLSQDVMKQILVNAGYDISSVKVYVSSEYGKTKRTGSLFRAVLSDLNVDAKRVVHIGDNLISDYLSPKKIGMRAFLYSPKSMRTKHGREQKGYINKGPNI